MGILYNRFTPEYLDGEWTLIKTFTEVRTSVSIDTTGKSELLVTCNDMVSARIYIGVEHFVENGKRIFNTNTNRGYGFSVLYSSTNSTIYVDGVSYPSVSGVENLDSVNVKVYAR